MRPTRRLTVMPPTVNTAATVAAEPATDAVAGLAVQREQAVRALGQTRAARQTHAIERAGEAAVKELESTLTGAPPPGQAGSLTARVVAAGDQKAGLPAVPLSDIAVQLKVQEAIIAEARTNAFGLVNLPLPPLDKDDRYELEVLAPDCAVLVCQTGRWGPRQQAPTHHVELARTAALQPHLERARPLEEGIQQARARAQLVREVAVKALAAQESRLVAYLAEIDAALACQPPST